jgi:hypothetical protein
MPDESSGATILRPWTIKAMPAELTERAARTARRRQETVAELVSRALVRELDYPTDIVRSDQPEPSKPLAFLTAPAADTVVVSLAVLARLAQDTALPGKDSRALQAVRRAIVAHAALLTPAAARE